MRNLHIISDGTVFGTTIECEGIKLGSVVEVVIAPIYPGDEFITATVKFAKVSLDIQAQEKTDG